MIGLLLAAAVAVAQPQTMLTVDPKHRLVEGIASDGKTIWVSSVLDRQILACRTSYRTIATLPAPLHPFAIAWDGTRKRLWVAADCRPGVSAIKPCERGALIGLSPTGRMITRIAPSSGSFHSGDVSAAPGGVFVSDSQNGAVYRLADNGYSLNPVVAPGVGTSGQGTALSEDGQMLVAADYSNGLARLDLASGERTLLTRANGKPLQGIDGLTRCGSVYYGIYNGSAPGKLAAITMTRDGIDLREPVPGLALPDPTQIAFDGKRLLIVADSGWATLDQPTLIRTAGTRIVAVPLGPDCQPQ